MANITLISTSGSGFVKTDFDQMKEVLEEGTKDINPSGINNSFTAGENLSSGDLCYLKDDGKMWKADADAEATADTLLALSTATISADATGVFLLFGKYTTSGLTAGAVQYVDTTAGAITETKPSGTGDIVRIVGYALSTTILFFDTDKTYIEVA